ncbi:MAG: DNA polymerase III subunit delta [Dehalococcoidia bacterium]|nr:MAG: DNA polymerase III subunit delta [Dehalococcoidia bacterium]
MYILSGQDDFSLSEALEEIKRGMGDQALLAVNTTVLDGQQVTPDQLEAVCETVPFLSERRLVIVKGLLGRFEAKSKSSGQKKLTPVTNRQNEYKLLAASISQIPDSTILVLIDGRLGSNNPLFKALSARAEVKTFPLLRGTELRRWIQRRVVGEGGSISQGAVDLLAKLVGSNLWIMKSEINKLVLFTSGRRIEEEDVRRVVSYAQQANVFAMVDAILEFKAGIAERSLHRLLERGAASAYLLVMLLRQVEMIVRAKELRNQGRSEAEIRDKLGLTSEFTLRKTLEQASRYSMQRLKEIYHKLLETDLSIKTGKYGGELALNILIAELCQRRKI